VTGSPSLALPIPLPKCGEWCCEAGVDGPGDAAQPGKVSLKGLVAPGNAFMWKLWLPVPGIGLGAAPDLAPSPSSPFRPPRVSCPGRSSVPDPDNPYLDTALSHRLATSAAGKRAPTGMCRGLPQPPRTAPVQSPPCRALPAPSPRPGRWPQPFQPQSFVSPSLPGPIPFLRDFLSAPFPTSCLLGGGLDDGQVRSLWPGRQSMPMGSVTIPSIRPHKTFSGLLTGKNLLCAGSRHEPSVAGRAGLCGSKVACCR